MHVLLEKPFIERQSIFPVILILILSITVCASRVLAQDNNWDAIFTAKDYFSSLEDAEGEFFENEFETPFTLLLNSTQLEEYNKQPTLSRKKEVFKDYWNRNNPNPIEESNPWLIDFIERNRYARQYYGRNDPPYYDDRGIYWIKYGKPVRWYKDHRTSFYRGGYFFTKYQDETWSYENLYPDLVVHFQKRISYFEALGPFQSLGEGRSRDFMSNLLLNDRLHVSPLIREIFQDYPAQVRMIFGNRLRKAKINAPSAVIDKEKEERRLKYFTDIAQFRGPSGSTRIEIAFLAPLANNLIKHFNVDSEDTIKVEYASMLRNINFEPVIGVQSSNIIPVGVMAEEGMPNAVGKLTMLSPPHVVELTTQVKDANTDSLGYQQNIFEIRDFTGDDLMVSGLQMYKQINENNTRQSSLLPYKIIEGFIAVPYIYTTIKKSEPVLVYYELYNLLEGRESADYEFEITVQWDNARQRLDKRFLGFVRGKRDDAVSFSQSRTFTTDSAREVMLLDLSDLDNGPYNLSIAVTDCANDRTASSAVKELSLSNK